MTTASPQSRSPVASPLHSTFPPALLSLICIAEVRANAVLTPLSHEPRKPLTDSAVVTYTLYAHALPLLLLRSPLASVSCAPAFPPYSAVYSSHSETVTKPTHRLRPFSTHRNFSHISSTPTFLRPFDASHDGLFSSPLRACLRVGLGLEHCFVPLCHCTHRHCTICPICICISLSQAASQACLRLSCTLFVYRITQPPEACLQC